MLEVTQSLLCVLPLLAAWLSCFSIVRLAFLRPGMSADWRLGWITASVAFAVLLTFIVEVASLFDAIDRRTLIVTWSIVSIGLFLGAGMMSKRWGRRSSGTLMPNTSGMSWETRILAAVIFIILAGSFVEALIFPTTNYDSLSYHLPRVLHWAQAHNVEHFATNDDRQIQFGPWSAFALLNLYLLSGNEVLFNLVQWLAMVSSLIASSLLAETFCRHSSLPAMSDPRTVERTRWWAPFLIATLPTGIVESTTTQVDYVAAFWIIVTVLFLALSLQEKQKTTCLILSALSAGIAALTKATVFIALAPFACFGMYLLWRARRTRGWRWPVQVAVISVVAFLGVNGGHMMRNYQLYGSPIGSRQEFQTQRNATITVTGTIANILRNILLNTNTGLDPVTKIINRGVLESYWLTGRGLEDPEISYHVGRCFAIETFRIYDSYASNPYHLALVLISLILVLRRPPRCRILTTYAVIVSSACLLFCIYLRWQMWHTRFHLAYFVLFAPLLGAVIAARFSWIWRFSGGAMVGGFALFCLFSNESRPLYVRNFRELPREQQYLWVHEPALTPQVMRVAESIVAHRWQNIGLKMRHGEPEYVFWQMLRNRGFQGRIEHVYAVHESKRTSDFSPDVVIGTRANLPQRVKVDFPYQKGIGPYVILAKNPFPEKR